MIFYFIRLFDNHFSTSTIKKLAMLKVIIRHHSSNPSGPVLKIDCIKGA